MALQPQRGRQLLHAAGKGFVKGRVAGQIDDLVGEFMKQQARKITFLPVDEGAEQRVAAQPVQIAEGGIGGHAIDIDFQPLLLELLALGQCRIMAEVAAITHAAGDRKAPAVQLQAGGRRGHHVPYRMAALQIGIARITGISGKAKLGTGKLAHGLG